MESFERNKIIVNNLIAVHDGDSSMVVTDVIMLMSLVLNTMKNKDAARLLATFAIEGITTLSEGL